MFLTFGRPMLLHVLFRLSSRALSLSLSLSIYLSVSLSLSISFVSLSLVLLLLPFAHSCLLARALAPPIGSLETSLLQFNQCLEQSLRCSVVRALSRVANAVHDAVLTPRGSFWLLTGNSEFFINLKANAHLDAAYGGCAPCSVRHATCDMQHALCNIISSHSPASMWDAFVWHTCVLVCLPRTRSLALSLSCTHHGLVSCGCDCIWLFIPVCIVEPSVSSHAHLTESLPSGTWHLAPGTVHPSTGAKLVASTLRVFKTS